MNIINQFSTAGLNGLKFTSNLLPAGLKPSFLAQPDSFLNAAVSATGLDDFGDNSFRQFFDHLVYALQNESDLNLFGVAAAKRDIHNLLIGRLKMEAAIKENPAILEEKIEAPLIIVGLPRAATTYLHALFAEDEGNRAPLNWEIMHPFPRPGTSPYYDQISRNKAARGLWWFHRLSGNLEQKHRIAALYPQECVVIMSYAFQSIRFDSVYHVPEFQKEIEYSDLTPSYLWHKRFLQYLQCGQPKRRWILKAPAHLLSLKALLNVYPDARLIQVNRDPVRFLPSLIGLTSTLQNAFTNHKNDRALARQIVDRWAATLPLLLQQRRELGLGPDRIYDVSYTEVTRAFLHTIAELYTWLGWDLSTQAEFAMQNFSSKRGSRRYTVHDFGLDLEDLRERFKPYSEAFNFIQDA